MPNSDGLERWKKPLEEALTESTLTAAKRLGWQKIQSWLDARQEKKKFYDFFGSALQDTRVDFRIPYRELDNEHQNKAIWAFGSGAAPTLRGDAIPKGVSCWYAREDLRAARHVAEGIAQFTGRIPSFSDDVAYDHQAALDIPTTTIGFGLGFTNFTHTMQTITDGKLFNITWGTYADDSRSTTVSDAIEIGEDKLKFAPTEDSDIAIVARIARGLSAPAKSRYFFVCAGFTAAGTSVAGWYLANQWKELLQLYLSPPGGETAKDLESCSLVVGLDFKPAGEKPVGSLSERSARIAYRGPSNAVVRWLEHRPAR